MVKNSVANLVDFIHYLAGNLLLTQEKGFIFKHLSHLSLREREEKFDKTVPGEQKKKKKLSTYEPKTSLSGCR